MAGGSAIAIYGLTGALADDGDLALTGESASLFESLTQTASKGTWNNCEKALVLNVKQDLGFCGNATLQICFQVANPLEPQLCAAVRVNVTKISTCKTLPCKAPAKNIVAAMVGDETTVLQGIKGAFAGDACPMVVWSAAFCVKEISQSSCKPCDQNTITITLLTNVPLYRPSTVICPNVAKSVNTSITIRALQGAIIDVSNSPAISFEADSAFASAASDYKFLKKDGLYQMVLNIANNAPDFMTAKMTFNFTVKNPSLMPTNLSFSTVKANGINIMETRMLEDVGNRRPMSICNTAVTVAQISQSTCLPCLTNTITVTLKGTEILTGCEARLTIAGLLGNVQQGAHKALLGIADNLNVFNLTLPEGQVYLNVQAEYSTSKLVIDVNNFPADTDVSFSFKITNPASSTISQTVSLLIDKLMTSTTLMTVPADKSMRPITVCNASFLETKQTLVGDMTQSMCYPSKENTITVSLRTSVPLNTLCDIEIRIGPLKNACVQDSLASFQALGGVLNRSDAQAFGDLQFNSSWDSAQQQIRLVIKKINKDKDIALGSADPNRKLLHFSFKVTNPNTGQASPQVFVEALAGNSAIGMRRGELSRNLLNTRLETIYDVEPECALPMFVRYMYYICIDIYYACYVAKVHYTFQHNAFMRFMELCSEML